VDRSPDTNERLRRLEDWRADVDRLHREMGIAGMSEKARRSFPGLVDSWQRTEWIHARARMRERRILAYLGGAVALITVLEPIVSKLLEGWKL
jgi:hypothetical protein